VVEARTEDGRKLTDPPVMRWDIGGNPDGNLHFRGIRHHDLQGPRTQVHCMVLPAFYMRGLMAL